MPKKQYDEEQPIYRSRKDRHRNKKKKHSWLPIVVVLAAFLIAATAGAFFATSSLFDNNKPVAEKKTERMPSPDKTVVMLMGVDEREDDVGRSDTLMIATLDAKKHKAAILSVPRDTRVKIKGHGFDKINAAYAYGGHNLTKNTVEDLLGVEMEHYVIINVHAFTKIIDAIGGIDIDVEKRMYYEDPWDDDGGLVINLYPGQQHMDGATAITYVRYRDEEGDIGRITRQQKFMKAVMDKLTSPAIIPRIPNIISQVVDSITTDLSVKQMIEFIAALKEAQSYGLQTEMLPGRPMYIGGISYWIPDLSKLRATVANTLDVRLSPDFMNATQREMLEYESSVPDDAQEIPMTESTRHKLGLDRQTSSSSSQSRDRKRSTSSAGNAKSNAPSNSTSEDKVGTAAKEADTKGSDNADTTQQDSLPEAAEPETAAPSITVPSLGKTSNN